MADDRRPNPDEMLARIKEEEIQAHAKLKIYLGAAPGVGKTHTMLEDAAARRAQGLDVVAGVVESHGRKEIEILLQRLEILPRKTITYHGRMLSEFDLDGALNRDPGLILIDEMAHTNVTGMRHTKRWQDIKELLDRGIEVYTTLNVQHIESLNDVVEQIIGIKVRETVPDSVLDLADTIEIVDLSPDDLLKRLQDGKVYIPTTAELATQHFFRKGNLTALRELALRVVADRVDLQILSHRKGQGIEQTWPTNERLLVCISQSPASAKVIRTAKRMANSLHSEWIAIHIDIPNTRLSEKEKNSAIQNLRLAEQLGAETRILSSVNVAKEIIRYARERNVSKIIVGKQLRARWREFLNPSVVDDLLHQSGEIDIFVVRSDNTPVSRFNAYKALLNKLHYGLAFVATAVATFITIMIAPYTGRANIIMIYMLAVVVVSLRGAMGPSFLTAILSMTAFSYFFGSSPQAFHANDLQYLLTLAAMLVIAQIISHLTLVHKERAEMFHLGEKRTAALYILTRQLASVRGAEDILSIAVRHVSEVFNSDVSIFLRENGSMILRASSSDRKILDQKEQAVVEWVYSMGQVAGLGTDTLSLSDAVYMPLLGSRGPVGVMQLRPKEPERFLIPEQFHFLETCANQIAIALEVDRLNEAAQLTRVDMEAEHLRTALFNSLSHELQQPLTTIVRRIKSLSKNELQTDEHVAQEIMHEANRLKRLMNTLLQITQLDEGQFKLNKSYCGVREVVTNAFVRLEKKLHEKPYSITIPDDMQHIYIDKMLIEQVFVHLIENAITYTPKDTPLEIVGAFEEDIAILSVADRGPGLDINEVEKVFEKFYRGQMNTKKNGIGLGLSICQSIVKAHGGKIWAENRWDGGAIFYFILPLGE